MLEIDFTISGIEVSQPYKSDLLSASACKVEFRGQQLTNCIELQYHVPVAAEPTISGQEYVNKVLMEEGDLLLQCFSLLLVQPSQMLFYKARLDGNSVELRPPAREMPPGLYNLVAAWRPPLVTYGYSSIVDNAGWPLLETLLRKFRRQPMGLRRVLALPLRWFAKGSDEMTSLDRLIAFWISFNALYENTDKSEQEAIKSYVQSSMDSTMSQRFVERNKQALETLSSYPIEVGRRRKRPIAQELAQLLKTRPRNYIAVVETAALTVYGVRNTVFHGGYDPVLEDHRIQVGISEQLLSRLTKELIAKQILGYPLPLVKFVTQQTFGF
ncbi:MAG: hypothetical protein DRP09_17840 [Candidatus Thorarchaeota archaeon]|nr:MAG: hypothetical protein DRP09_17840 [Candidatus Thorarchaeota archaeon]